MPDIVRDYRETNTSSSLGRLGANCVNMYYSRVSYNPYPSGGVYLPLTVPLPGSTIRF